jgi:hypothetical protein
MPARVERVEKILYPRGNMTPSQKEQAYRTAWANIRDWITAQMALIDTQMVKPEYVPLLICRARSFAVVYCPQPFYMRKKMSNAIANSLHR